MTSPRRRRTTIGWCWASAAAATAAACATCLRQTEEMCVIVSDNGCDRRNGVLTRLHIVTVRQYQRHNCATIVGQRCMDVGHDLMRIGASVQHVQAGNQIDVGHLLQFVDDTATNCRYITHIRVCRPCRSCATHM